MNQLRIWLDAASKDEKQRLAAGAETSVGTLAQIAGGYRTAGVANVRAGLARKLEKAAAVLRKQNRALPPLLRTDLAPECQACDFAQRCLGDKAALSGFPILPDVAPVDDREGGFSTGLPKFDRGA